MRAIRCRRCFLPFAWAALGVCLLPLRSQAGTVEVTVLDAQGDPIERVAVQAKSPRGRAQPQRAPDAAVMDQRDQRFDPHMLVVQKGTPVLFPNNDDVSHHVYSFSPAKRFELGLYKGDAYPPVVFDTVGVVEVGCNIHDGMLGYIVVVDTPFFAVTDERGVARIDDVPAGSYTVEAWTPRARPSGLPSPESLTVAAAGATRMTLRVSGRLAPDHDHAHRVSGLSWDRY
jgi:plastocyanin